MGKQIMYISYFENKRLKRYNQNVQYWNHYSGYIYGQHQEPACRLRLGSNRMADVGCEIIALYNTMRFCGQGVPLPQIIYDIERMHMTWFHLGGVFGLNPAGLYRYLNYKNIKYKKYKKYNEFALMVRNTNQVCIVGFRLKNSIFRVHTVAFYFDGRAFCVLNRYNDNVSEAKLAILEELFMKKKFIAGYIIKLGEQNDG